MHRIRVVTISFRASTYNQGPTTERDFDLNAVLIFLRRDDEGTFFARIEDIPTHQPDPPQHLPEYEVETKVFERSTRTVT